MTRKIAMTTIRTVLTMLNSGFSYCKIRHHTGASNGFINKLASVARPDLEAFLKLSDEEIYERVYPKTPNSHCEPDWEAVNDLLQKKHMTLQLVYDEYCRVNAGRRSIPTRRSVGTTRTRNPTGNLKSYSPICTMLQAMLWKSTSQVTI